MSDKFKVLRQIEVDCKNRLRVCMHLSMLHNVTQISNVIIKKYMQPCYRMVKQT